MNKRRLLELAGLNANQILSEAKTNKHRSPSEIKHDLEAMAGMIAIGKQMRDGEVIKWAKREFKALEDELVFIRHGTTAVK